MDRKILGELACPHCRAMLNKPVTMPCGHHVCASCMEILCEGRSKFNCPACSAAVQTNKCIPNALMDKVIQELSNVKVSDPSSAPTAQQLALSVSQAVPPQQHVPFFNPSFPIELAQQHQQPMPIQFLPLPPNRVHPSPAELIPVPQPLPLAPIQQGQGSDRLVLTHNQRQYIRYVVVTDCDTGTKYTVGIKHVLNTVGSNQLVQLLERNIGSDYKKGSSKRVCKSVVHRAPCAMGSDCPFIHVTPEGWEARRKFSSANQKRNKDAVLAEGSLPSPSTMSASIPHIPSLDMGIPPGDNPFMQPLGPSMLRIGPQMLPGQAGGWMPSSVSALNLAFPSGSAMDPLTGPMQHPHAGHMHMQSQVPPLMHHPSQQDDQEQPPQQEAGHQKHPMPYPMFPFPIPILNDLDLGSTGHEKIDVRHQREFHGFGSSGGTGAQLAPIPTVSSSSSASTTIPVTATISSTSEAKESSAASTSSSIGAISSISSGGSPLVSPLIESIATSELPDILQDKTTDFAEESRMIPYFNKTNNFWKA